MFFTESSHIHPNVTPHMHYAHQMSNHTHDPMLASAPASSTDPRQIFTQTDISICSYGPVSAPCHIPWTSGCERRGLVCAGSNSHIPWTSGRARRGLVCAGSSSSLPWTSRCARRGLVCGGYPVDLWMRAAGPGVRRFQQSPSVDLWTRAAGPAVRRFQQLPHPVPVDAAHSINHGPSAAGTGTGSGSGALKARASFCRGGRMASLALIPAEAELEGGGC